MKRIVRRITVSEVREFEAIRSLHGKDYFIYAHHKDKVDKDYFPMYEEYINKIFNDEALEFIYMTCISGYKKDELISFEVTINNDYLKALHLFINNLLPYKNKLLKEWDELAEKDSEIKKQLRNFWKYELYFQCFYKEENE